MLIFMSGACYFAFAAWSNLLNNFAVEEIGFTGREIGILQSIREIPGFLAFTAVFVLLILREQTFAVLSLLVLGAGVAITGYFPSIWGFYFTTLIMSIGFHYHETVFQSLSLQWLKKDEAPRVLGRIVAVGAFSQLTAYGLIFVAWKSFELSFTTAYLIAGVSTILVAIILWIAYPHFKEAVPQHKKVILRRRYWLYYALTFMGGARRQIFVVFAGFLMVERFGFHVHEIAALFILNCLINMVLAPKIGDFIARFGERRALTLEYIGLIGIIWHLCLRDRSLCRLSPLCRRPCILCHGNCHEDLFPEDCRSGRYRADRRRRLYDQSHRGGGDPGHIRPDLALFADNRLPARRRNGWCQPGSRAAGSPIDPRAGFEVVWKKPAPQGAPAE